MHYFKVKTGYGTDEAISIDETELPKAIRAQVSGRVAVFRGGTVAGNHIISIVPDWARVMGWNDGYKPNAEDLASIGASRKREYEEYFESVSAPLIGPSPMRVAIKAPKP